MASLFETIRNLVMQGRYIVGEHATMRLEERGILEWQVVDGIEAARLMAERPNGNPNPLVELEQRLADGARVKAVWSHVVAGGFAKLVTVHFMDQ